METKEAAVSASENLDFTKTKAISYGYLRTRTTVHISDSHISIRKYTKKTFRKMQLDEQKFERSDILSADIRTTFDFWNTLIAILGTIIGLFDSLGFLLTAAALWAAYGKKITLHLRSGETYDIVSARKTKDVERLLAICASSI